MKKLLLFTLFIFYVVLLCSQDSTSVLDIDSIDAFRVQLKRQIDDYVKKDREIKDEHFYIFKENYHFYLPFPMYQKIRVNGFLKNSNIVKDFQIYQNYTPFLNSRQTSGTIWLTKDEYDLPILLSRLQIGEGYAGSKLDQAAILMQKAKIWNNTKISLGFLGDNGRWLSDTETKSKSFFAGFVYDAGFAELDYNYFYFDKDISSQALLFNTNQKVGAKLDSAMGQMPFRQKIDEQQIIFKNKFFRVGWDYSRQKYSHTLFGLNQEFYSLGYFYLLGYDIFGQSFAFGYEGLDRKKRIVSEFPFVRREDTYGEIKLDFWGFKSFFNTTSTSKNLTASQKLPYGFTILGNYHKSDNKDFDTSFIYPRDAFFNWKTEAKKGDVGFLWQGKYIATKLLWGSERLAIDQFRIKDSLVSDTLTEEVKGDFIEGDIQLQLPFSMFENNFRFGWTNQFKKADYDSKIYNSLPEYTYKSSVALSWLLKHKNILTFGFTTTYHSEFFKTHLPAIDELSESQKLEDYFLQLDITEKFFIKYSLRNYKKEKMFYGEPILDRHSHLNFTWYLFD